MKTSEVLNTAADLIEERGWVRGEGWIHADDPNKSLCLEGGIQAAMGLTWEQVEQSSFDALWACPAYNAVRDYLEIGSALFQWNDRVDRTQAEVVEVLRATAVIEAAKEEAPVRVAVSL